MERYYNDRRGRGPVKRGKGIRRVGFRLFVITLTTAWGFFTIGAKIGGLEHGQKPIGPYMEKVIDNTQKGDWENAGEIVDSVYNQSYKGKDKDIDDWRILLVNADNPIPEGYSVELSMIDGARKFDSRAVDDLMNLIENCRYETRYPIWAQSTYRDRKNQERLFNDEIKKYINMEESRGETERLAGYSVAAPGTSEHETGLAVDFNNINMEFENSPAFEWLVENSHEYGFILRYPRQKESITGITYEPWHFRYVGREHAKEMKRKNFCLEEYIDYLKQQRED